MSQSGFDRFVENIVRKLPMDIKRHSKKETEAGTMFSSKLPVEGRREGWEGREGDFRADFEDLIRTIVYKDIKR